ncbi:MAG: hypothetical protein PHC28_06705 [Flavobacterium sp.]|uniref:hypothetical protein n=1 Tax=Flavobacterium sp. TaxID=239 RepID=UPI002605124F|nr:hypothetical protein [Flavobacterium sp.]MDD5150160.1 hypothetical protein [Flavobacterium sp.]
MLYNVEFYSNIVIEANSLEDAEVVAREQFHTAQDDIDKDDVSLTIKELKTIEDFYKYAYDWDTECLPYGSDGNKNIGEYFNA